METVHRLSGMKHSQETVVLSPPTSHATLAAKQSTQQRQNQRLAKYQQVWKLHQQGWSAPVIAHRVGLSSRTVQRYLNTAQFPERQPRSDRGKSLISPFKNYLLQRWNEGIYEVKQLFAEIQLQGYQGSYMTVTRYVRQLAQAQGWQLQQPPKGRSLPSVADPKQPPLTARRAAWLLLRRPEKLQTQEEGLISGLSQQHPVL